MKTRIVTAVAGLAVFLTVLFLPWTLPLIIMNAALCAIAIYEVFTVTNIQHRGLTAVAMVFGAVVPFFFYFSKGTIFAICLAYALALVLLQLRYHEDVPIEKLGAVFLLSVWIAFALSCLTYLRLTGEHGLFYVILAFTICWLSDTGAYFMGTFFGKHKLCPKISPKKTVEGFIGGIASAVLLSLLAAFIYQCILGETGAVSYIGTLILSVVCAPLSVVGDLFASLIKRRFGVKDYGNLFPGHGGVMDRFDSTLFVLPLMYLLVQFFPFIF